MDYDLPDLNYDFLDLNWQYTDEELQRFLDQYDLDKSDIPVPLPEPQAQQNVGAPGALISHTETPSQHTTPEPRTTMTTGRFPNQQNATAPQAVMLPPELPNQQNAEVPGDMMSTQPQQQANLGQEIYGFKWPDQSDLDLFGDDSQLTERGYSAAALYHQDAGGSSFAYHVDNADDPVGIMDVFVVDNDDADAMVDPQQHSLQMVRFPGHMYPDPTARADCGPCFVDGVDTIGDELQQLETEMQHHQSITTNITNSTIHANHVMANQPCEFRPSQQRGQAVSAYINDQGTINPSFIMTNQQQDPQQEYHPQYQNPFLYQEQPGPANPASPQNDVFDMSYSPTATPAIRDRSDSRQMSTATGEAPSCIDCGKRYRTSTSPGRCTRCGLKYERAIATPRIFTLDPAIPNIAAARTLIYPAVAAKMNRADDDVHFFLQSEDQCIEMMLEATNDVQVDGGDEASEWRARQQKVFNEKAKMEEGYANASVTARLRALFREMVHFHLGGAQSVYAIGGDNQGYSPNLALKFSERLAEMCGVMRQNKRVVMDVVEGRGVQGFVNNPWVYHHRKASNNNCNNKKKEIMQKGKEVEGSEGDDSGKKRKRKRAKVSQRPAEVVESIEDVEAGPSTRTRGALRAMANFSTESTATPGMSTEPPTYSPGVESPLEQEYGSGRSRTAAWIHGR